MLLKEAVLHIQESEYIYPISKDEVHLYLRVAKNNVKTASLIYYDPADWDNKKKNFNIKEEKMHIRYEDALFSYFFISLKLKTKRMRYEFLIIDLNDNKYHYNASGFVKESVKENLRINDNSFNLPYILSEDLIKPPKWADNTIWYQIFPDRFFNNEKPLKDINTNDKLAGGTLNGIRKKIPYLKDLGVTGVYLTPIFKADTAHRYDTVDYELIDPVLGTEEDLISLIEELHKNNIKIMLDGVFNHTSNFHPAFIDAINKGKDSPYYSSYFIKNKKEYETFANVLKMPKVNHENTLLEKHFLELTEKWFSKYKIDAIRLDVSNEISLSFLRKLKKIVTKYNGYMIGENWDNYRYFMGRDLLDGVMNYQLSKMIWNLLEEIITPEEFINQYNTYLFKNQDNYLTNYNQVGSHDTIRLFTRFNDNIDKFYLANILMFISKGSPSIYYGDEINMSGKGDPDCRRIMQFNKNNENKTYKFFKTLNALRKKYPIFNEKDLRLDFFGDLFYVRKRYNDEKIFLIANFSKDKEMNVAGDYMEKGKELFGKDLTKPYKLKPYEFLLIKL